MSNNDKTKSIEFDTFGDRFKFRVYHKPTNKIYDLYGFSEHCCHTYTGELFARKDCVLLQCTGLKDKNGNLIYKGDIVECASGNTRHLLKVVWLEKNTGFFLDGDNDLMFPLIDANVYKYEVIGNIHENGELLQ